MHPLRRYREDLKLTQAQLAERLNVSRNAIARWEIGMRKIGPASLSQISDLTGIPAAQLRPDLAELIASEPAT